MPATSAATPSPATRPRRDCRAGRKSVADGTRDAADPRISRLSAARTSAALCTRRSRSLSSAPRITESSSCGTVRIRPRGRRDLAVEEAVEDHRRGRARERRAALSPFRTGPLPMRRDRCAHPPSRRAPALWRHVRDGTEGCARGVSWSSTVVGESGLSTPPLSGNPIFARPKSRIFASPRSVTKMFAGLRSRWTMPGRCATSSASAISRPETPPARSAGVCPL